MPLLPFNKHNAFRFYLIASVKALRLSSGKFRYQPKPWLSARETIGEADRSSLDRLTLIRPLLLESDKNVLDLGSNAGFFSIELGLHGLRCHGVERDPDLVVYATMAAHLRNVYGVSFELGELNEEFVTRVEAHDVILNFSIMHHLILHRDLDYASRVLAGLRAKTGRVMFMEMGQSDEAAADWAQRLPSMKPDPEAWIADWLRQCGYASVRPVGRSEKRIIFAAHTHE